jgi:hypothetical protein
MRRHSRMNALSPLAARKGEHATTRAIAAAEVTPDGALIDVNRGTKEPATPASPVCPAGWRT